MDKFVLVLAAALCFSTSAIAEVTCRTDVSGDIHCTGYDKDGNYVNTTAHKDVAGNIITTGSIGNRKVNTTAHKDVSGNINTTGHVGNSSINTVSHTDVSGKTTTSGSVGKKKINYQSRKDVSGNKLYR